MNVPRVARLLFASLVAAAAVPAQNGGPAAPAPPRDMPVALVPVPNGRDGKPNERTELLLERARTAAPARVVLVGDSITEGFEGAGKAAWGKHVAPLGAVNLGSSGDRTEHVLWRLQQASLERLQPEHVVLMLGTNNLGHGSSNATETLAGLVAVVRLLRTQCPAATIHVLEIFPRDEHFSALRGDVLQVNQALRAFVRAEQMRGGAAAGKLQVHATGDAFVAPDGSITKATMPDALHLSAPSYEIWGQALAIMLAR
jgi:lysophospholipase L1-like esterase